MQHLGDNTSQTKTMILVGRNTPSPDTQVENIESPAVAHARTSIPPGRDVATAKTNRRPHNKHGEINVGG